MEASFNGGGWTRLCDAPTGGAFSGTIANQTAGQGTLSVRWIGNPDSVVTVATVGVGDVFVVAGQSNAVGFTESNQSYSHATLKACLFGNDYNWKNLTDPTDINTNQVDAVSSDSSLGGSLWPSLATSYMAGQGCPCAFVPCAFSGSKIENWQPGANHQDRTTLYGSMVYRALQTGCKCVLWWQGEQDAVVATSRAQYNSWLDTLANAIASDLGVKLMPCKIEILNDDPYNFSTANVNGAIGDAWADNSNVLTGPDFSADDWGSPHYGSANAVAVVAPAWWSALRTAFGW